MVIPASFGCNQMEVCDGRKKEKYGWSSVNVEPGYSSGLHIHQEARWLGLFYLAAGLRLKMQAVMRESLLCWWSRRVRNDVYFRKGHSIWEALSGVQWHWLITLALVFMFLIILFDILILITMNNHGTRCTLDAMFQICIEPFSCKWVDQSDTWAICINSHTQQSNTYHWHTMSGRWWHDGSSSHHLLCCGAGPASPSRGMVRPNWWLRNGATVSGKLDWSKGASKHAGSILHEREFPWQRCKLWRRPWSWLWLWAWTKPRELTR